MGHQIRLRPRASGRPTLLAAQNMRMLSASTKQASSSYTHHRVLGESVLVHRRFFNQGSSSRQV